MYISRDLEAEKNIFSRSSIHLGQPAVDLGTTSMDQDLAGHPGTQRKWLTHIKHGHIMVISIGKIWKNHQMGYEMIWMEWFAIKNGDFYGLLMGCYDL